MQIPERVRRFLKRTNSFAVIMEDGKPEYILASFDWAERAFLGAHYADDANKNADDADMQMEEANRDFSLTAETKTPTSDEIETPSNP